MEIHVNELTLPGNDAWTNAFNSCSESYKKAMDTSLSEEEREEREE